MRPAERSARVCDLAGDAASLLARAHVLATRPGARPLPSFVLSSLERIQLDCAELARLLAELEKARAT